MVKHTWDYCGSCHCPFVRCGKCGNNCCNGAYGRIDGEVWETDKELCNACPSAYEMQSSETPPEFTEEYKAKKIKAVEGFFKKE